MTDAPNPGGAAPAAPQTGAPATLPGLSFNPPPTASMTGQQALETIETIKGEHPDSPIRRAVSDQKSPASRWFSELYRVAYADVDKALAENPGLTEADLRDAVVHDKAEDYQIAIPAHLQHQPRDPQGDVDARTMFHSVGLNHGEANALAGQYFQLLSDPGARVDPEKAERVLRGIWPGAGEYDTNMRRANRVLKEAKISDRLRQEFEAIGALSNPTVIKMLADVGKRKGW